MFTRFVRFVLVIIIILLVHLFILTAITAAFDKLNEFSDINYEVWNIKGLLPNDFENYLWSQHIEIPFHTKRHIAKIESNVQIENEKFIEDISLYICSESEEIFDDSDELDRKYSNYFIDNVNKLYSCDKLLAVWLSGDDRSKSIELDESVGIPIGGNDREKYLLLKIEYKNIESIKSISDSPGFTLYIDKLQRDNDAGILAVGLVPDYRFFIPPKLAEWTATGSCYQSCLETKLDDDGINIVNVLHFGKHFLLTELTLHLIENQEKNKMLYEYRIKNDIKYSLNDKMHVNVKKHNQLSVKCKYNSLNETLATLGGFSPNNEQCIAWLLYYPKLEHLDACLSSYSLSTIMSITGIDDLEEHWRTENDFDILLKQPNSDETQTLENFLVDKTDWDYKLLKRSNYGILHQKQVAQCGWRSSVFDETSHV